LVALVDDVEQPDDVRVVQLAQHLGLPQQALPGPGDLGGRAVQGQALERDLLPRLVAGEVDDAHPAPSQAGDQVVAVAAHQAARLRRGREALVRTTRPRATASAGRGGLMSSRLGRTPIWWSP